MNHLCLAHDFPGMELEEYQGKVEEFVDRNGLEAAPGFRVLDLVSEIGELVKDATKSSDYGLSPGELEIKEDEIGDVLFSLLAVANSQRIDAAEALETALEKYSSRIEQKGEPGSGSR